jgi:hypothetical protein
MTAHNLSLAEAFRCDLVTAAELREIEREAAEIGRQDIGKIARAELSRRAELSSRVPLYLRFQAARKAGR